MDKAKFWEKQYRKGHGRIVEICYRYVNDWAVAQDLAQDVFLRAMETFKAYRAFGRFDAWLTRIAVNHCIDYLRQKPDFVTLESKPVVGANNYSPLRTDTETSPTTVVVTQPDTLPNTKETTNPVPVIITKKVPVRRTVVIRDTTIVSDTVYQVGREP